MHVDHGLQSFPKDPSCCRDKSFINGQVEAWEIRNRLHRNLCYRYRYDSELPSLNHIGMLLTRSCAAFGSYDPLAAPLLSLRSPVSTRAREYDESTVGGAKTYGWIALFGSSVIFPDHLCFQRLTVLHVGSIVPNHTLPVEVDIPMWTSDADRPTHSSESPNHGHNLIVRAQTKRDLRCIIAEEPDATVPAGQLPVPNLLRRANGKPSFLDSRSRLSLAHHSALASPTRLRPYHSSIFRAREEMDLVEQLDGTDFPSVLNRRAFKFHRPSPYKLSTSQHDRLLSYLSSPILPHHGVSNDARQSHHRILSLEDYSGGMRAAAVMLAHLNANLVQGSRRRRCVPHNSPIPPWSSAALDWIPELRLRWCERCRRQQVAPMRMKLQHAEAAAIRARSSTLIFQVRPHDPPCLSDGGSESSLMDASLQLSVDSRTQLASRPPQCQVLRGHADDDGDVTIWSFALELTSTPAPNHQMIWHLLELLVRLKSQEFSVLIHVHPARKDPKIPMSPQSGLSILSHTSSLDAAGPPSHLKTIAPSPKANGSTRSGFRLQNDIRPSWPLPHAFQDLRATISSRSPKEIVSQTYWLWVKDSMQKIGSSWLISNVQASLEDMNIKPGPENRGEMWSYAEFISHNTTRGQKTNTVLGAHEADPRTSTLFGHLALCPPPHFRLYLWPRIRLTANVIVIVSTAL
ncbi:hypothetical protein BS47DRAFT_1482723 [Hydnum rufescens UP504]|uniref:Uncharacterized protein n=1 Tax=Hydnum rufescens UP504 TaxID=1448309 RepID=A0A9P6B5P6_9AGAM|nr:hypothetical protein BS47DRAFT_1482723 [Hydnum rufescens UP504]